MPPRIKLSPLPLAPEKPPLPVVAGSRVVPAPAAPTVAPPPSGPAPAGVVAAAVVPGGSPVVVAGAALAASTPGAARTELGAEALPEGAVTAAGVVGQPGVVVPPRVAPVYQGGPSALLRSSSTPALPRSRAYVFKCGIMTAGVLAAGYFGVENLVPVLNELRAPAKVEAPIDKEASTLVKALQKTRQVTTKNNANVALLNSVIEGREPAAVAAKPVVPPVAPPVVVPTTTRVPPVPDDLTRFHEALAKMKIDSAMAGAAPRAVIDGRLTKFGEIVDRTLGLRFVGVDTTDHVVLFSNADNVIFRKHY